MGYWYECQDCGKRRELRRLGRQERCDSCGSSYLLPCDDAQRQLEAMDDVRDEQRRKHAKGRRGAGLRGQGGSTGKSVPRARPANSNRGGSARAAAPHNLAALLEDLACAAEAEAVELEGSEGRGRIPLGDGRRLDRAAEYYPYRFALAPSRQRDGALLDGETIAIVFRGRTVPGHFLYLDGEDACVVLREDLGPVVRDAWLGTATSYLYRCLAERLRALEPASLPSPVRRLLRKEKGVPAASGGYKPRRGDLNPAQAAAVQLAFERDLSYIWGPPGTGKTRTLAHLAREMVAAGRTVLIVSHTNVAVDNALARILEAGERTEHVLRLGAPGPTLRDALRDVGVRARAEAAMPDELRPAVVRRKIEQATGRGRKALVTELLHRIGKWMEEVGLDEGADELGDPEADPRVLDHLGVDAPGETDPEAAVRRARRGLEDRLIGSAPIIGATLTKGYLHPGLAERRFDAVIVDEASMASVPLLVPSCSLGEGHLVIVGDFQQLAPITRVRSDEDARSLLLSDAFEFGGIDHRSLGERDDLALLDTQYRMAPEISSFPRQAFYRGRLQDGRTSLPPRVEDLLGMDQVPRALLVDTEPHWGWTGKPLAGNSRFNLSHTCLTAQLVAGLTEVGFDQREIGVIAPYREQAKMSKALLVSLGLDEVVTSTVHRFLGLERRVIIFDLVEAGAMVGCGGGVYKPGKPITNSAGRQNERLLNVALTRARDGLFILGPLGWLEHHLDRGSPYRRLIEHCREHERVWQPPVELDVESTANRIRRYAGAGLAQVWSRHIRQPPRRVWVIDPHLRPADLLRMAELDPRPAELHAVCKAPAVRADRIPPDLPMDVRLFPVTELNEGLILAELDDDGYCLLVRQSGLLRDQGKSPWLVIHSTELGQQMLSAFLLKRLADGAIGKRLQGWILTCPQCKQPVVWEVRRWQEDVREQCQCS